MWLVAAALALGACGSDGIDAGSDMAGLTCTSIGAHCVATEVGEACPSGELAVDAQTERYCGSNAQTCCLPACPASPSEGLGHDCMGPRVCDYVAECTQLVCQPMNGRYSWHAYVSACP